MVTCPDCNASVLSPEKTWSITGDIDENGIFVESQVGIYLCSQCSIKFPYAFSKDKLSNLKSTKKNLTNKNKLKEILKRIKIMSGPIMIVVKVKKSNYVSCRVKLKPKEIRNRFMNNTENKIIIKDYPNQITNQIELDNYMDYILKFKINRIKSARN